MPALVRRGTIWQRLRTVLDPKEVALWIAEELNDDRYYDSLNRAAIPLSVGLNIIFILLRNHNVTQDDDVFGDAHNNRFLSWLRPVILHGLAVLCCANAVYALLRKKQYQLLHQPLDEPPTTPSASRVQLDMGHGKEQVWQINVWQPKELSLTFFTYFSPIHILLYYVVLPSSRSHALLVGLLAMAMSAQFAAVQDRFVRQAQDTRIIHGQVLNEYNAKFVQPLMHRPVRDVAVQAEPQGRWTVDAYSPGMLLNRGTKHINYTPTSRTTDSGTNTRRFVNGHTPTQSGLLRNDSAPATSAMRQRQFRTQSEQYTPTIRYSDSEVYTSPAFANGSRIEESEGDEIRVVNRPSPTLIKNKRKSFRPSR